MIENDGRAARRRDRLGPDAVCALCGITTPECLTRVNRSLLERHHVAGRAHDGLTVVVCRNCHARLTEGQRTAGVDFAPQATVLERLAAVLVALGAFLCQLGETLTAWAARLLGFISGLDREFPAWREMPEGRV